MMLLASSKGKSGLLGYVCRGVVAGVMERSKPPTDRHAETSEKVDSVISDQESGRMLCAACIGMGKVRRVTCAIDPGGRGHTLVHMYDCRTCGGEGWRPLTDGPPV